MEEKEIQNPLEDDIEEAYDDIEEEEEIPIKKQRRKPRFTPEHIEKMRALGRTPEAKEKLKRANDIKRKIAQQKRLEKMKEELMKNGIEFAEKKQEEKVEEQKPEITPPVPTLQPTPVINVSPPTPPPMKENKDVEEKPPKTKKKKPKRRIEYEEQDDEEDIEPVQRRRRPIQKEAEINEDTINRYLMSKVSKMQLKDMEDRLVRRQYDMEIQKMKEDMMSKMIVGRYY